MPRKRALGQAFRERLAESTPSAKLTVRGRASRSRHKSDAATIKRNSGLSFDHRRGQSQISEREQSYISHTDQLREHCPRPPSNSEAFLTARPEERGATNP